MGAYAVVGIGIKYGKLFKKETRRCCEHDVPLGQQFCGTCGKPREKTGMFYIDEGKEYNDGHVLGGHAIYRHERPDDKDIVVIGAEKETESESKFSVFGDNVLSDKPVRPDAIADGRKRLMDLFEKYGLEWDESKFGVWAVGSY